MSEILYHGSRNIGKILREGILQKHATHCSCRHIWLARTPEDAKPYGDVVEVDMSGLPILNPEVEEGWQALCTVDLEPWRLTRVEEGTNET